MTLTCSVKDPAGFRYDWYRETPFVRTFLQAEDVYESNRVFSQDGGSTGTRLFLLHQTTRANN